MSEAKSCACGRRYLKASDGRCCGLCVEEITSDLRADLYTEQRLRSRKEDDLCSESLRLQNSLALQKEYREEGERLRTVLNGLAEMVRGRPAEPGEKRSPLLQTLDGIADAIEARIREVE